MEYGQHDRHKGSSLAMGLQYFCYGTLNSYEFSNATTAVNNGESARNKGGKTRGMGERNTFLLPPPPPPRLFFFVVSPEIRKVSATDRSIVRSIVRFLSSLVRGNFLPAGRRKSNRSPVIIASFGFSCLYIL